MPGPFATATELSEETGTALPVDLSRWQAVLRSASDLMRLERGQELSFVTDETVTFAETSSPILWLWETPAYVTSVTENGVLLASTEYTSTVYGAIWHTNASGQANGTAWPYGATVVYSHGYQPSDRDYGGLRALCIRIAGRALFSPELTQGLIPVDTSGWAPQVFLTEADRMELMAFGPVAVG